jgi:hypothetical protein
MLDMYSHAITTLIDNCQSIAIKVANNCCKYEYVMYVRGKVQITQKIQKKRNFLNMKLVGTEINKLN